jgi:hypothetical protein
MIGYIQGVYNGKVMIVYDHDLKAITVSNQLTNEYRAFCEFADMKDLYDTFFVEFSIETDYNTAIRFFQPNIVE